MSGETKPGETKPLNMVTEVKLLLQFFNEELPSLAAELPFDLLPGVAIAGKETATVADFKLAKLHQLTQGEEFVWSCFVESATRVVSWEELTLFRLKAAAATLLLLFRHDPAWTVGKTMQLGTQHIDDLYDFFIGERTHWKALLATATETEAEPETATTKKPRSTSGRRPSGDSPATSPAIDASETTALAVVA